MFLKIFTKCTKKKALQFAVSYHGLHIESEVTGGATGDNWWLFCAPSGVTAALGTIKANCPFGVGTTWKPEYSFTTSVGKFTSEPVVPGNRGADPAGICVLVGPSPDVPGCGV